MKKLPRYGNSEFGATQPDFQPITPNTKENYPKSNIWEKTKNVP